MDTMSDDEDQIQHNPQFQRLMELKNLYNEAKNNLKVSNHYSSTTVSTAGATFTVEERTQTTVTRKPKSEAPDSSQLIAAIRSLLLKHGGSSHIDTVVEHIRSRFPTFRRRDGNSALDTKKTIQSTLRYNSRGIIQKDEEGNLILGESEVDSKDLTAISTLISQAIEEGVTTPSTITNYVLKNFARSSLDSTDDDLREGVTITLKTNPKFKRDSRNNYYTLGSPKKSRISKPKRVRSEEDNSDDSSGDSKSPPPGYSCRCGASLSGKGQACKWRKGASGESLCNSCGLQYNKKKEKKKEKEKEKEKEIDNNPWICCDKCHKWLRAKSDNIDDISIYDDSNPNHLDYYCPTCRAKGEKDSGKTRSKSNRRSRIQEEPTVTTVEVKVEKKRVNGGRKRRAEEEQSQPGDSKLDVVEKELLRVLENEEDAADSMDLDEGEKYRSNINKIADDIRKLKNSLVSTRNTIWEKNQKDFEGQVEKLELERRSLNERAELDLVKQLRDFYEKKKPKSTK